MKIRLFRLSVYLIVFITGILLAACSNEHDNITEKEDAVSVNGIKFKVQFFDYDTTKVETRSAAIHTRDTLRHDTVSIGNGLMAEVCVTSDTLLQKPVSPAQTRALSNGIYLLVAYQSGVLKGALVGTISGGVFSPNPGYNKSLALTPGTYTFILTNQYFQSIGNELRMDRTAAGKAMIGKLDNVVITPTPRDQTLTLTFSLKHVGSLVATVLRSDVPIGEGQITGYLFAHGSPMIGTFTMPANSYSTPSVGDYVIGNLYYKASSPLSGTNYAWQNDYLPLLPLTLGSNLSLVFTGGNLFNQNLAGYHLRFNTTPNFYADLNKIYHIQVNLWPNFLYLMNDGSVALTRDVPAKVAVGLQPIGLVLSRSHRMAIALRDVPMGPNNIYTRRFDLISTTTANNYPYEWYINDMDGWRYTWDPNYVAHRPPGTTVLYPRADQDNYATGILLDGSCWRAVGYFNPGPPLIGSLAGGRKSYLPTIGEWKYLISALHAGSIAGAPTEVSINANMANRAFTQFGGGTVPNGFYYTSTEINPGFTNCSWNVKMEPVGTSYNLKLNVLHGSNIYGVKVRPFFKY